MIVGVCGLGYTGSGAVVDLLKEYCDIQVEDKDEFGLVFRPDGLQDLQYHINNPSRYMASDIAILRFIKLYKHLFRPRAGWGADYSKKADMILQNFVDNITQVQWKGIWSADSYMKPKFINFIDGHIFMRISSYMNRKHNKLIYPNRTMYLSVNQESFLEESKKLVSDIFLMLGYNTNGILILNQPFAGNNPYMSFPFFHSPKAIIVDKDPRDLYFQCKYEVKSNCTWTPCYDVKKFVAYYRAIRKGMTYQSDTQVLHIKFEDLIYEYDKTICSIEQFLGIESSKHITKKKYFNPEISINNTQLFRKYSIYADDIAYIEQELSEYLYPYENYEVKTHFGASYND